MTLSNLPGNVFDAFELYQDFLVNVRLYQVTDKKKNFDDPKVGLQVRLIRL